MARYVRGDIARISGTFKVVEPDGDEVLTTPTTTTVAVTKPDGTLVTPIPTVLVASVGSVYADVIVDMAGPWHWRMVGAGAAAGVFEGGFYVLQSPFDDLLRVAQFRAAHRTSADDETIQLYIDAATQAIVARYGRLAPIVERRVGGGAHVWLSRRAASITSIVERWDDPIGLGNTALDAGDWLLLPDGISVRREVSGTHPGDAWSSSLDVTYTPLDTTADRQRAVIALVKLDLSHNPGKVSETIADWSATYNNAMSYSAEREMILDTLAVNVAPFA